MVEMSGQLVSPDGRSVVFDGQFRVSDNWDFRMENSGGRTISGNIKTFLGKMIPGDEFPITSVPVPIRQNVGKAGSPEW